MAAPVAAPFPRGSFVGCICSHAMVSRHQADPRRVQRISGPLLDRIDIHVAFPFESNIAVPTLPETGQGIPECLSPHSDPRN
jgi:predicted ATPase with chaperone activity